MIVLEDRIYGKEKISEPLFLDLILTKELQRLKNIAQYGIPSQFYHLKGYSRYEHSLGVFILLRKLNASIEEQIAGLSHDISHTAFSHVVDWVFNSERDEDHQDKIHNRFIANSKVKEVVEKYNYNINKISNIENFSLLEQEIPLLCVDRVDYCLRDELFDKKVISLIVESITTYNNKVIFNSHRAAKLFGENFMKCQTEHWGGTQALVRYKLFSNVIKIAMENKIITKNDFFKDDNYVVNKLVSSNIKKITDTLDLLYNGFKAIKDRKNPGFELDIKKKFRYVNPCFLENGKVYSLLDTDKEYAELIEKHKQINKQGLKIRILVK